MKQDQLSELIAKANPDFFVGEAGAASIESLIDRASNIHHCVWVVKAGNEHMGWDQTPDNLQGRVEVTTWNGLVEERKSITTSDVPPLDKDIKVSPMFAFYHTQGHGYKLFEYTSEVISRPRPKLPSLT